VTNSSEQAQLGLRAALHNGLSHKETNEKQTLPLVANADEEGQLHSVVTDHVAVHAEEGSGPAGCGMRVMQPWPNNLTDLEQARVLSQQSTDYWQRHASAEDLSF